MVKELPGLFRCLIKRDSNSLFHINRSLVKLISQRNFTKWKKIKPVCGCSTFWCQRKEMGSQNSPHIVKSPFKHLEIPNITVQDLLWGKIDKFPDYTAVECGITGRKYTFAQIKKLSQRFAVSLLKSGIQEGQTVAIISQNCPEYPIVVLGCMEAGVIVTLVNYIYTADEICHQLKDSEASCVITALNTLNTTIAAINKVEELTKSNKPIKLLTLDPIRDNSHEIPPGVGHFSELIADTVDATELPSLRKITINPSKLAVLPYSSGTTGLSKGVQLSHRNLVSNVIQLSEVSPAIETTKDHQDVLPGILPFYHIYGFTAIMTQSILFGCKVVTLPKFEPQTFLKALKDHKCSILCIVPPLVLFLGSNKDVTSEHLRHVRSIISGAAPIGEGDIEKCLKKVPKENNVISKQAYGLTESSPCISIGPDNPNLSSIGSPVSNTLMKIVNIENGDCLGPNQNGEVCAKGPQIMMGYHNNPKATAATVDSDGWLHTGDIGYHDENGLFYIADRIKELIKVKGFQVPPAELEELLRTLPGVKDAGVVGIPNEKTGEVPIAFVVQSSSNPATVSDIKTFLLQKVAPYKQISDIVFVDAIPKSAAGKILRREIRETYLKSKQN